MSLESRSQAQTLTPQDSTIILGGGIIGLSTAYYLSLHQPTLASSSKIHIVDSGPSLLLSASGNAGGFLARDWFSPASASLGELSFLLHQELADTHDGGRRWGFAKGVSYSLSVDEIGVGARKRTGKTVSGKDWLVQGTSRADDAALGSDGNVMNGEETVEMLNVDGTPRWITTQEGGTLEIISSDGGCAQVEPKELCEFLLQEVKSRGVEVHLGAHLQDTMKDDSGKVAALKVRDATGESQMPCKNIIITSGAWSSRVFQTLFPDSRTNLGIGPLAGYSIVVRSPRCSKPILDPPRRKLDGDNGVCVSVFCAPGPHWTYAPEAMSRMTKLGRPEIYVAGLNDSNMPLPPDVTGVKALMDPKKSKDLRKTTVFLTGLSKEGDELVEDDLEVVRESLCFRPISNSGVPVIAKLNQKQLGPGAEMSSGGGVYVAAGHGPWGISLSLGTGLVVSELLQDKQPSADISDLGLP